MGAAEWLARNGWVGAFLAACAVMVAAMLYVPWHAFRGFRKPLEDRDRYRGVRRHGRRWARRRAASEGRHRTMEGGQSTWQYIDSGAWAIVDKGRAEVREGLAGQETTVLSGRRLTPSDTEGGPHGQGQRALGTRAA